MYKKIFLVLVIVIFLLAVNFFVAKNFIENGLFAVVRPLFSVSINKILNFSSYGRDLLQAPTLNDKNAKLQEENDKLTGDLAKLNQLKEENDTLRVRLNIVGVSREELIFANIFSIRGEVNPTSFLINKGTADGIEDGLAVVTAENILAGVISKAYLHNSLVLMPQNINLNLNVKISGKNILARSKSDGGQTLLDFVTSQDEIKIDDLVVTSGLDKIDEAIPVFKVSNIKPTNGNLFQEVTVSPIFNILEVSKVFIIKP